MKIYTVYSSCILFPIETANQQKHQGKGKGDEGKNEAEVGAWCGGGVGGVRDTG